MTATDSLARVGAAVAFDPGFGVSCSEAETGVAVLLVGATSAAIAAEGCGVEVGFLGARATWGFFFSPPEPLGPESEFAVAAKSAMFCKSGKLQIWMSVASSSTRE